MDARNRDSCRQLLKNLKIRPLKSQYFPPFRHVLPKIEIHMNEIQKFIILTLDLVLTYLFIIITLDLVLTYLLQPEEGFNYNL